MLTYNFTNLPFVSKTGKVEIKKGWCHNGRTLPFNLLVIIHNGECVFEIDGILFNAKAGDAIIVPKNTYYKPYTDSFVEYTFFHFDGIFELNDGFTEQSQDSADEKNLFYGVMEKSSRTLPFENKICLKETLTDVDILLSKCVSLTLCLGEKTELLFSVYFTELMFYISKQTLKTDKTQKKSPTIVGKIINYINENYRKTISLDVLAGEIGASKQYCMRAFKKSENKTIEKYILDMRMNHAAYLLKWTYMNVCETADYLGFSSVSYFSRVFKQYYGANPSSFVKNLLY